MDMGKLFNWMFAAVLICCGGGLASCGENADNPVDPKPSEINPEDVNLFEFEWHFDLPGGFYLSSGAYSELK